MSTQETIKSHSNTQVTGLLAKTYLQVELPLQVLRSAAGYYIGTADEMGAPVSRESVEYFPSAKTATEALSTGSWTQKHDA